jgi:hypothetical protein
MPSLPPVIQAWVWVPARLAQWVTSAAILPSLRKRAPLALTKVAPAKHLAQAARPDIILCLERRSVISPLAAFTFLLPHRCPNTVIQVGIRPQAQLHAQLYPSTTHTHQLEPQRQWRACGVLFLSGIHLEQRWEPRFSGKEELLVS